MAESAAKGGADATVKIKGVGKLVATTPPQGGLVLHICPSAKGVEEFKIPMASKKKSAAVASILSKAAGEELPEASKKAAAPKKKK